jgi:hypothetical protein
MSLQRLSRQRSKLKAYHGARQNGRREIIIRLKKRKAGDG